MTKEQLLKAILRTDRTLRRRYALETRETESRVYEGIFEALYVLADELQAVLEEDE